jgi:exopolysaccharide biosynthesis predicted pyruvyltransferase EpsI
MVVITAPSKPDELQKQATAHSRRSPYSDEPVGTKQAIGEQTESKLRSDAPPRPQPPEVEARPTADNMPLPRERVAPGCPSVILGRLAQLSAGFVGSLTVLPLAALYQHDSASRDSSEKEPTLTAPTILSLRSHVLNVLHPLVAGRRVALLDFPNYSNCGDSAIWAGEVRALKTLRSSIEVLTGSSADLRRIKRLPKDVVILLSGGGNFGDLYPRHQSFREAVAESMPRNRIVQLPQSIHFSSESAARTSGAYFRKHSDFHLLVRDHQSAILAESVLDCPTTMCPDMALMLDLQRQGEPHKDVFVLARTDAEARVSLRAAAQECGLETDDWYQPRQAQSRTKTGMARRVLRSEAKVVNGLLNIRGSLLRSRVCNQLAAEEVDRGLRMISQGRVLLTDRLHAHILAELAGIPHVVVDTGYGKIREFHSAWLGTSSPTPFAESPAAGCEAAKTLSTQI